MSETDVFHAGEIAVQERAGERSVAERRAAMIADRLVEGARTFLGTQGVAAVAAAEPDGAIWASLWSGDAGFLRSDEHGAHVEIVAALDHTRAGDPVRSSVRSGASLGMLVIDFVTRRRLRINGSVTRIDARGLKVRVRETFGNCMKYIQRRQRSDCPADGAIARGDNGLTLDEARREFIGQTDTAFVASIHPERGLDASHRGGHPGFIHVRDERTLRIPDYPGNAMFQTFGNFAVDARAGLALIDFERRRVLSLTGSAIAGFGAEDPRHPTGGTGRYLTFTVERWVEFALPSTMKWTLLERSPLSPPASNVQAT